MLVLHCITKFPMYKNSQFFDLIIQQFVSSYLFALFFLQHIYICVVGDFLVSLFRIRFHDYRNSAGMIHICIFILAINKLQCHKPLANTAKHHSVKQMKQFSDIQFLYRKPKHSKDKFVQCILFLANVYKKPSIVSF